MYVAMGDKRVALPRAAAKCSSSRRALVVSVATATQWAYDDRPKGNPDNPPSVVVATE
ncbi:MAG: hypothetical protein H7138_14965 [Myxococcales bacterium]|nr:hypothetical protein [Myxococcales bacterium]